MDLARLAGIAVAVYLALRLLLPLVLPFFIALFLAKQLHPLVLKIDKRMKIKEAFASLLVLLLFLSFALAFLWFVGRGAILQIRKLMQVMPNMVDQGVDFWCASCTRLSAWTGMDPMVLESRGRGFLKGLLPTLLKGSFFWAKNLFFLAGFFLVILISTFFLLKDYNSIKKTLGKGSLGSMFLGVLRRVHGILGAYIRAQLIIMCFVSVICIGGLFLIGKPYALVAGMGIGFCDALPFLGTGILFLPWALLEIINGQVFLAAVYVILYGICTIVRQCLEPKLIGKTIGVPPLFILVSIYAGLQLYGLWGFLLGPLSFILVQCIWLELLSPPSASDESCDGLQR
jgi:sporulation integral membrane protein YtvI